MKIHLPHWNQDLLSKGVQEAQILQVAHQEVMVGGISPSATQLPDLCDLATGDAAYMGYWFVVYIPFWRTECYPRTLVEPLMGHSNILLD